MTAKTSIKKAGKQIYATIKCLNVEVICSLLSREDKFDLNDIR